MASPGNQHFAKCIGTLSFPIIIIIIIIIFYTPGSIDPQG